MPLSISGLACVVFDCAQPAALAEWWQRLVGGDIVYDDDGDATLHLPGWPRLDFIRVPEPKTQKLRLHIDVSATDRDQAEELQRLLALGAVPTDVGQKPDETWHVLADPEGNEFCLLRTRVEPV